MYFEPQALPETHQDEATREKTLVYLRAGIRNNEKANPWRDFPHALRACLDNLHQQKADGAVLAFEADDGQALKRFMSGFRKDTHLEDLYSWCAALQETHQHLKCLAIPVAVILPEQCSAPLIDTALHARRVYLQQPDTLSASRLMSQGFPLGGGAKEVLLRSFEVTKEGGPFPYVRRAFFELMTTSFPQDRTSNPRPSTLLLRRSDRVMEDPQSLLRRAVDESLYFMKGDAKPVRQSVLPLPGESGRLQLLLEWREYAEQHFGNPDCLLAATLAKVFSGGSLDRTGELDESALLRLEHEALTQLWADRTFRDAVLDG